MNKIILSAGLLFGFLMQAHAAEQERTFSATHPDRATACSIAKQQAEETAKRSIGVRLKRTTSCDCSKQEYAAGSTQAIASGQKAEWTCLTSAVFE